ncbi:MAG: glycoside hydrolase family 16 protein [Meiothermus sp.]|nr:glycoside hydrolase family 16 protein [Meiothermus sp.]
MDFPPNPLERPGYTLEFSDEFDRETLDTGKWFPYLLPHWSSLERTSARYALKDGSLRLRIEEDQPTWVDGSDRVANLQTGHFSGPKGSQVGQFRHYNPAFVVTENLPTVRHYTPLFGYFEVRLKALAVTGYHTALWMIGFDQPQAGEIRCFELHGGNIEPGRSRVDTGILSWDDPNLMQETYEDWLPFNAAEYHVYGVEWTPERVDFYVDNRKFRSIEQSPKYPMQFMLGLYERPHELRAEDAIIPFPRVCEIDYFRAYRAKNG